MEDKKIKYKELLDQIGDNKYVEIKKFQFLLPATLIFIAFIIKVFFKYDTHLGFYKKEILNSENFNIWDSIRLLDEIEIFSASFLLTVILFSISHLVIMKNKFIENRNENRNGILNYMENLLFVAIGISIIYFSIQLFQCYYLDLNDFTHRETRYIMIFISFISSFLLLSLNNLYNKNFTLNILNNFKKEIVL